MKVRYWNAANPLDVDHPKQVISQIKLNGTIATSLPAGDIRVSNHFFIVGGRGSIAQFLASSGNNNCFFGANLQAMYFRFNGGMGKHYTVVAVKAGGTPSAGGMKMLWQDLTILQPKVSPAAYVIGAGGGPAASNITTIAYQPLANALRSAEAKLSEKIADISLGLHEQIDI